jgi:hypothetical protein
LVLILKNYIFYLGEQTGVADIKEINATKYR